MSEHPVQNQTIRTQLIADMMDGPYAACDRLPRESVLSEKMGISRTQLRDILASLEREGFITRRHGVGTIINRHVLNVTTRMDIEVEFLDMIRQSGHEPGVAFVQVSDVEDETNGLLTYDRAVCKVSPDAMLPVAAKLRIADES